MKKQCILDADWYPVDDEDLKRQHRALLYLTDSALRREHMRRRMDRMVDRLFNGAVVLFALAALMAYFTA